MRIASTLAGHPEHKPIEIAYFLDRVISIGLVEQASIVPDHDIAGFPSVAILKPGLGRMFQQHVEQRRRFCLAHTNNFLIQIGLM
jgi:hypothetical protein